MSLSGEGSSLRMACLRYVTTSCRVIPCRRATSWLRWLLATNANTWRSRGVSNVTVDRPFVAASASLEGASAIMGALKRRVR